ncbi:MAG TPA: VWA domain-containing protein [Thermoanaerobaculia bacterium]|nr:VWA domain-containing protein [Thermoanaerobaculia bacterium]
MRTLVALSSLLLLTGAAPQRSAPAIPSLGESIEVALVNVDVVVVDRDGKRVRGLKQSDFEVYENGKLQPLSHFAEYRGEAAEGAAGVDAAETTSPEQRRSIVLFVEKFKLQDFRIDPFFQSMKSFVRETVRPGDAVSLVTFDGEAAIRVKPTDDVAAIEQALDGMRADFIGTQYDQTGHLASDVEAIRAFEAEGAAMAASRGMARPVTSDASIIAGAARSYTVRAELDMKRRVAAINALINGLAGVEGKKIMLLAAHRLGSFVGAEYYYAGGATEVPVGEADKLNNIERMRRLIANANAAGVSLYPVFPAGLDQTPGDPSIPNTTHQVLVNEMAMRQEIAEKTGGLTSYGTAEIVKLLPRVADDVSDYYSLAYRASTRRSDDARNITVKTKDPKLEVRARKQFVEKSDDSHMRDRVVAAIYDVSQESPVKLAVELGAAKKTSRNRQSVPVKVRVPIGALTLVPQDGKHLGAFSVYVMTGAKLGYVSDITRQTQSFEVSEKELARAMKSHFTYDLDVVVNEGADHVAVGVLDEVSKTYGVTRVPLP